MRKFDHHCVLIGGCVGEDNHFNFYIYLLIQTIALGLAIYALLDTISDNLDKTNESYKKVPFILYVLLIILGGYCFITVCMNILLLI